METKSGENQKTAACADWTWRDTLKRIEHIDEVITNIVSNTMTLNAGILSVFALLTVVLYTLSKRQAVPFHLILSSLAFAGVIANSFSAKNLARQEWVRQWYFAFFPKDKLPLVPPKSWPKNQPNLDEYEINYKELLGEIGTPEKSLNPFLTFGRIGPGYAVTWICIHIALSLTFLFVSMTIWII